MPWIVLLHPDFDAELQKLDAAVRRELAAQLVALKEVGPAMGRPAVDTLNGSKHANMKELRFISNGVWRFCFAFDPKKNAIVLCGGNKQSANASRFYKGLIAKADARYQAHLDSLRAGLAAARKADRDPSKRKGP